MATIETLEKRVAGKEKEIEKLTKKLTRIMAAKESNWENNPYYYREDDIKWTTKDLQVAEAALEKYKNELEHEKHKANSRNVKVLMDFLEAWKEKTITYFLRERKLYKEAYENEYKPRNKAYIDWLNNRESWELRREDPKAYKERCNEQRAYEKEFKEKWSHIAQFNHGADDWETTMRRDVEIEKNKKYDDIVEKTVDLIGDITDASNLYIAENGELNGIIIGTDGSARINTFGAGGWNIQRYHFRTKITKVA